MVNFNLQLKSLEEKFRKEFPQAEHFIILYFKCLLSYDPCKYFYYSFDF